MPAVNEAIDLAKHDVPSVVVVRREEEAAASVAYDLRPSRDHDFAALVASPSRADPVPLSASAPLYTIYTSGSTGDPKGILRDNSHAVTLKWSMTAYYGTAPGETFFAASDIGVRTQAICHCLRFLDLFLDLFLTDCLCSQWVVGHSYIVYAPLLHGCTSVMFGASSSCFCHAFGHVLGSSSRVGCDRGQAGRNAGRGHVPTPGKML